MLSKTFPLEKYIVLNPAIHRVLYVTYPEVVYLSGSTTVL